MNVPPCKRLARLLSDRRGATAIEYGLILAIITLGAMGAMTYLANRTSGMWNYVQNEVVNA